MIIHHVLLLGQYWFQSTAVFYNLMEQEEEFCYTSFLSRIYLYGVSACFAPRNLMVAQRVRLMSVRDP